MHQTLTKMLRTTPRGPFIQEDALARCIDACVRLCADLYRMLRRMPRRRRRQDAHAIYPAESRLLRRVRDRAIRLSWILIAARGALDCSIGARMVSSCARPRQTASGDFCSDGVTRLPRSICSCSSPVCWQACQPLRCSLCCISWNIVSGLVARLSPSVSLRPRHYTASWRCSSRASSRLRFD